MENMTANATSFLTIMAMLSSAASTLTDHVLKMHIPWLDEQNAEPRIEALRQTVVHVIAGAFGAAVACAAGLHPLHLLGGTPAGGDGVEYLIVGVAVSYGGSFFNEALDLLRLFKLKQEDARNAVLAAKAGAAAGEK